MMPRERFLWSVPWRPAKLSADKSRPYRWDMRVHLSNKTDKME